MKKTTENVERIMDAASGACAKIIEAQLEYSLKRIQREHLSRHTLELQDAMGSIGICVYVDKWFSGSDVVNIIGGLENWGATVPECLRELEELLTRYCEVADLSNVACHVIVEPEKQPNE